MATGIKEVKCKTCYKEVSDSDNVFEFPLLPDSHKYKNLHGTNHVDCLLLHPDSENIKDELTKIYESIYNKNSDYPIIANWGNILVQDRRAEECIQIYNFDDFVQFHMTYQQGKYLLESGLDSELALGINLFIKLKVLNDGLLLIEREITDIKSPMPSLNFNTLEVLLKEWSKQLNL